jgi:hypothetical protein
MKQIGLAIVHHQLAQGYAGGHHDFERLADLVQALREHSHLLVAAIGRERRHGHRCAQPTAFAKNAPLATELTVSWLNGWHGFLIFKEKIVGPPADGPTKMGWFLFVNLETMELWSRGAVGIFT